MDEEGSVSVAGPKVVKRVLGCTIVAAYPESRDLEMYVYEVYSYGCRVVGS